MSVAVGELLHDRYRIENIIARGGMGAIYRAVDESLGVAVAVKENLFGSQESTRQFRREATILASLRHPNLPRVTDHFVIEGQGQYLVMDFIEGEDLLTRIDRRDRISDEEVVLIGAAVCDALSYLHSRTPSVIHRDIKPGNIKITPAGQIYLVDFGLAKTAAPGQATTIGAQALTPGYAPPEQYGQGTEPRSDLYALGATLYAALTHTIPEDALARAMGSVQLTPILKLNPHVSPALTAVIEKAMSVQMDDRYPTADAFKQALLSANTAARQRILTKAETAMPSASNSAAVSSIIGSTAKPKQRAFPWLLAAFGGLLAVGLCLAVVFFVLRGQFPSAVRPTASLPAPTAAPAAAADTPSPTQALPPPADPTETLPSPATATPALPTPTLLPQATALGGDPGQIAFVSNRTGTYQIYTLRLDNSQVTQVTDLTDGACQPDWSPDGQRLVFVSPCRARQATYKGSSLFLINADGSGLTPLVSSPGGDFHPDWSPDGTKIAFTSIRQNNVPYVFIYDLAANRAARLTNTATNEIRPTWSPNGEWIAFESTRLGVLQVWVMDAEGKNVREFSRQSDGAAAYPTWSPAGDVIVFSRGSNAQGLVSKQYPPISTDTFPVSEFRPALNADYSPDGFWLLFESTQDGNLDLYRMNSLSGANLTRLTDDPAEDFDAVWRPAGN